MIERHSEDTQTLHAELLTLLLALEADRSWSHLAGAFTSKTVAGGSYLYFQYSDPGGKKRQFSIGRESAALQRIIETHRAGAASYAADRQRIDRLARLLATAGQATLSHSVARVIAALADSGVFRLGGVLVGTYAFLLLGNALGVRWPAGTWRTEDVDVAGHLELATPALEADVPRALDSLQMGFVPVPPFDRKHASTSFKVRGQQLRLDLLTPGSDRSGESCYIPRFKAAAAPIKFLSLVMTDGQPAAAVNGGATLVVVPGPAPFALHKLFVSQTRTVVQQTKSTKDLHQAALLLEVLAEDRPDDLEAAVAPFNAAGPAVTKKVARGLVAVGKGWPEAENGVSIVKRVLKP